MSHITAARFWMAYGSFGFPRIQSFGADPRCFDAVDSAHGLGNAKKGSATAGAGEQHPFRKEATSGEMMSGKMMPTKEAPKKTVSRETASRRSMAADAVREIGELGLVGGDDAVHLLSLKQGDRRRSRFVVAHSCGHPLPIGSVLPVSPSLAVCSPALTFVQMGTVLPKPLLAFFGMQLCGIYAVDPFSANATGRDAGASAGGARMSIGGAMSSLGSAGSPVEGMGISIGDAGSLSGDRAGALPKRAQLMTVGKLQSYLDLTPGLTGRKRAQSALRLVGERSRSPMESVAFLLLCAPPSVGGFGLPRPLLNCVVELPAWLHWGAGSAYGAHGTSGGDRARHAEGATYSKTISKAIPYAEADMLFSYGGRNAIVDYHGGQFHKGEGSIHHDALRANAFQDLGIPHFTLTKRQLFDDALLEKAALQIAGCLGFRLRPRIGDAGARRRRFRRELLSGVLGEWWGMR